MGGSLSCGVLAEVLCVVVHTTEKLRKWCGLHGTNIEREA